MKQYIYGKNPIMEALKGASVYKIYIYNTNVYKIVLNKDLRLRLIVRDYRLELRIKRKRRLLFLTTPFLLLILFTK